METVITKVTKKYQATIPKLVRTKLGIESGDGVAFDIEDNRVVLRKANPIDIEFHNALTPTLGEWASANDEEAYNDL